MKSEEKKENCEISEISKISEIKLPSKICQTSCRICQSKHLKEIHSLKKDGSKLSDIVSIIKKKYGEEISAPSLCRHFQNYDKIVEVSTAEVLRDNLIDDVTKRSVHSAAVVKLIDGYLSILKKQLDNGMKVNIPDLEKLFTIQYKLLSGGEDDEKNLTVIFQNFADKYKVDVSQPRLFNPDEPQIFEKSPERKEEDLAGKTLQG